jgi:hypothetical protein
MLLTLILPIGVTTFGLPLLYESPRFLRLRLPILNKALVKVTPEIRKLMQSVLVSKSAPTEAVYAHSQCVVTPVLTTLNPPLAYSDPVKKAFVDLRVVVGIFYTLSDWKCQIFR